MIIFNTNLHLQRHTLWPLRSWSTRIWSKLTPRVFATEMLVAMEEEHLSSLMWIVATVSRRSISRNTARQRELAIVETDPISPQISFHNRSLRSMVLQTPKIFQHPPWPATTRSTSIAPLAIMVMMHEDFIGRMAMMSGNISKERNHLLVFTILPTMQ